jgi:hypothetical protein
MKVFHKDQTRDEYLDTQIKRSQSKFQFCKVSYSHVLNWKKVLERNCKLEGPILCLGTRNGREIDLFRTVFRSDPITNYLVKAFEVNKYGWKSRLPFIEAINRSKIEEISSDSILGVEVNPDGKRSDVFVGSFDEMPLDWENQFGILYSNSFDQSQDPLKTAKEWIRISKNNAIIIIGFNDAEPTLADPTGCLSYSDFLDLFPGELLYFNKLGSNYDDIIIRLNET